jgi:hypothetical protein
MKTLADAYDLTPVSFCLWRDVIDTPTDSRWGEREKLSAGRQIACARARCRLAAIPRAALFVSLKI